MKIFKPKKYTYLVVDMPESVADIMVHKHELKGYKVCGTIVPYKGNYAANLLIPMRKQL